MINAKVGDTVMIECYTSMGSGGKAKVTAIKTRYNEKTGKPYKVICCGKRWFRASDGDAMNEPTMYYISHVVKEKPRGRTNAEAEAINKFVRSKSKKITSKRIK